MVLLDTMARSIKKFKFLLALFSHAAYLTILLALLLFEACSYFIACTILALIVVLGSLSSLLFLESLTTLKLLLFEVQEPF